MNIRLHFLIITALALAACSGEPPAAPPEHELTHEEQAKARLDESMEAAWNAAGLESLADIVSYTAKNAHIKRRGTTVTGTLDSPEGTIFEMNATLSVAPSSIVFEGFLPEEITFSGTVGRDAARAALDTSVPVIERAANLDAVLDVTIYDRGVKLCRLGAEPYHYFEAGEDRWTIIPVLRFDDGTSYGLVSLLLVQPVVELILKDETLSLII